MKHFIAFLASIALAICFPTMSAAKVIDTQTGQIMPDNTSTAALRSVETTDDGIMVTYTFPYIAVDSVMHNGEWHYILSFEDFPESSAPGKPRTPMRRDAFDVPITGDVTLSYEVEYSSFTFKLIGALTPTFESRNEAPEILPLNYTGFYPTEFAALKSVQSFRKTRAAYTLVAPVRYNPSNDIAEIASSIRIRILIDGNGDAEDYVHKSSAYYSNSKGFNSEVTDYDYLILTTSEYDEAVNYFADWKKAMGFNVHTCQSKWSDNSEIKDSIDYYTQKYPDIRYLLLVGDHRQVPSMPIDNAVYDSIDKRYKFPYHITDLYYGTKDHKFKDKPDLLRGRIPASTNADAMTVFSKIAAYEYYKYNIDPDFFVHSLHIAEFQDKEDKKSDGYEDVRFVKTSEEILETLRELGADPIRVYGRTYADNYSDVMPQRYSKSYGCYGQTLPDELLDPNFDWNGNSNKFRAALSKGVFYVLRRGHGSVDSYSTPSYTTTDVKLENFTPAAINLTKDLPIKQIPRPVYFNYTCLTGRFSQSSCLATAQLLKPYGGASCVIAATQVSYTPLNDYLALSAFDAFLSCKIASKYLKGMNYTNSDKPIFRIGEIMDSSLYVMRKNFVYEDDSLYNRYQYEIFHIFGDPSMMMRTESPTEFRNASIYLDKATNTCHVKTGEGDAYIAFFDKDTDEVKCYYTSEVEFQFSNIKFGFDSSNSLVKNQNVMIYAPNKIPILHNTWLVDGEQLTAAIKECDITLSGHNLVITANCETGDEMILYVTNALDGSDVMKSMCDPTKQEQKVDISKLSSGTYIASLIINSEIKATLKFNI